MVAVTYTARPGDPTFTRWHGLNFEHGKPVDVPDGHHILVKDAKTGKTPVDGNDWFSVPGKAKRSQPSASDPETPAAYFTYAAAWISKANTSGGLKSRWDQEQEMREDVGWGADDQDKMDEIMKPKFESLKKDESTVR